MADVVDPGEWVVLSAGNDELKLRLLDLGIPAVVHENPFGREIPGMVMEGQPGLLRIGGSVSFQFAIRAIKAVRECYPQLQFLELGQDLSNHLGSPETEDYVINLYPHEAKPGKSGRMSHTALTNEDFEKLDDVTSQPAFHYYVRSFFVGRICDRRPVYYLRYIGGPRDGRTVPLADPPELMLQFPVWAHVPHDSGKQFDHYEPRTVGKDIEMRFLRTNSNPRG